MNEPGNWSRPEGIPRFFLIPHCEWAPQLAATPAYGATVRVSVSECVGTFAPLAVTVSEYVVARGAGDEPRGRLAQPPASSGNSSASDLAIARGRCSGIDARSMRFPALENAKTKICRMQSAPSRVARVRALIPLTREPATKE